MERWVDFDVVTRDALASTLAELGVSAPAQLDTVTAAFDGLPLVDGAGEAVRRVHGAGLVTGILTNASTRAVQHAAEQLALPFDHLLSVDAARRSKPDPGVYRLAVEATGLPPGRIGFVTANGWDAAGAGSFGFRVAWLRPNPAATLPDVGAPTPIVATWADVPAVFARLTSPTTPSRS
jgi:2-haloacid dehalogenase